MRQSQIMCYNSCPRQYKYQYVDGIEIQTRMRANDGRIVGTAVHPMFEKNLDEAVKYYKEQFRFISEHQIAEMKRFELLYPMILEFKSKLKEPEHELFFRYEDWTGTADLIDGDKLYDYKYSNNIDYYLASPQLHLYAYFLNKLGYNIKEMYFVFVPKTFIRRKKTETKEQFYTRLTDTLKDKDLNIIEVKYDQSLVDTALEFAKLLVKEVKFPKIISKKCDFCDYKQICQEDKNND